MYRLTEKVRNGNMKEFWDIEVNEENYHSFQRSRIIKTEEN